MFLSRATLLYPIGSVAYLRYTAWVAVTLGVQLKRIWVFSQMRILRW